MSFRDKTKSNYKSGARDSMSIQAWRFCLYIPDIALEWGTPIWGEASWNAGTNKRGRVVHNPTPNNPPQFHVR